MTGALLRQILTGYSHHLTEDIFDSLKKSRKDHKVLKLEDISKLIKLALKSFNRFYICIDALDESGTIHLKADVEDIKRYVTRQLEMDENYDDMSEDFRKEILETIVSTADGMFLLPALQIQAVLEQPSISHRQQALKSMPKKLDDAFRETIDRIKRQALTR
ncbi:hypothetical protein FPQ18DRAFT_305278 [Pyronema domesticum]|nr:hypothetical protein FPQ18DRAFT_305278 [Pyronema domesticum]